MNILETHQLKKTYFLRDGKRGKTRRIEAVRGLNLAVRQGEVFAFLGPNGVGKSTTLRMLTTLLPPDSGSASLCGFDLTRQPAEIRRRIGYVGQSGGSDGAATVWENLVLQGRLYGANLSTARLRTAELCSVLGLAGHTHQTVGTLSSGLRRRLDIALALTHRPRLLFLDEPTTGLDPSVRAGLWEEIRRLRTEGATVFLTTHYLDEADALADRLAFMDQGTIVAEGTPQELKRQISGDTLVFCVPSVDDERRDALQALLLDTNGVLEAYRNEDGWRLRVDDGPARLPDLINLLARENVAVVSASVYRPSLDDVFLRLTGRSLRRVEATESVH